MGQAGGIDDNPVEFAGRVLDGGNDIRLAVGLHPFQRGPLGVADVTATGLHVGKCVRAIDFRLTGAEHVQVRPVDCKNGYKIRHVENPITLCGQPPNGCWATAALNGSAVGGAFRGDDLAHLFDADGARDHP